MGLENRMRAKYEKYDKDSQVVLKFGHQKKKIIMSRTWYYFVYRKNNTKKISNGKIGK